MDVFCLFGSSGKSSFVSGQMVLDTTSIPCQFGQSKVIMTDKETERERDECKIESLNRRISDGRWVKLFFFLFSILHCSVSFVFPLCQIDFFDVHIVCSPFSCACLGLLAFNRRQLCIFGFLWQHIPWRRHEILNKRIELAYRPREYNVVLVSTIGNRANRIETKPILDCPIRKFNFSAKRGP